MASATYHHGNLRAALVEAAVAAARESGPDGLVVRHLARRVGVSHNAAYRHFSDRDALVAEVAEVGMSELTAAMRRRIDRVAGAADPDGEVRAARARLVECGRGYVDFALAQPGLFRVLFAAYPSPPELEEGGGGDPDDPFAILNTLLDDLVTVGHLAAEARVGAEISCWSAVHGFAVLHSEGPLRDLDETTRTAALDVLLDTIDRSYGATGGAGGPG